MKKVFIVTGTTRGLGKQIVSLILEETDHKVISVSRRLITDFFGRTNLVHFDIDLADNDVSVLFPDIIRHINDHHVIFVNNAATINPINNIGDQPENDIITHVNVNLLAPILLINRLEPYIRNGKVTIINITSGVVNNVIAGWSLYCSTKSAMDAYFRNLAKEHTAWEIKSVDPGVMDTNMQMHVRNGDFKEKERFESFKLDGKLENPETVANSILSDYL